MFHLCQLDPRRQERAALAGIIPSLIYFMEEGTVHFLRELATSIFLDLPKASQKVRDLLWKCECFPVYVRLLDNASWLVDVLTCFLNWLRAEPELIACNLGRHVNKLTNVCGLGSNPFFFKSFVKALEPLLGIVQECPELAVQMVNTGNIYIFIFI